MSSEALRLAQALDNHQAVEEDAADMLRTQAASIASLEAERDQLRAEVERLRKPLTDEQIESIRVRLAEQCQAMADKGSVIGTDSYDHDLIRLAEQAKANK